MGSCDSWFCSRYGRHGVCGASGAQAASGTANESVYASHIACPEGVATSSPTGEPVVSKNTYSVVSRPIVTRALRGPHRARYGLSGRCGSQDGKREASSQLTAHIGSPVLQDGVLRAQVQDAPLTP